MHTQTKKNWEVFTADIKTWETLHPHLTSPFMEIKLVEARAGMWHCN